MQRCNPLRIFSNSLIEFYLLGHSSFYTKGIRSSTTTNSIDSPLHGSVTTFFCYVWILFSYESQQIITSKPPKLNES